MDRITGLRASVSPTGSWQKSPIGVNVAFLLQLARNCNLLLLEHWRPSQFPLSDDALIDEEGIAAILQATGGNFRLIQQLLAQVVRVLQINGLAKVTAPIVEAAREHLVIGAAA